MGRISNGLRTRNATATRTVRKLTGSDHYFLCDPHHHRINRSLLALTDRHASESMRAAAAAMRTMFSFKLRENLIYDRNLVGIVDFLQRRAHWRVTVRQVYLSCMIKRILPDQRILAVLDNWRASTGRTLTADEIEQALEETTLRYSFAPQVQSGPQYLVTIVAPAGRFDAAKFDRALDEAGDVNPLKQPAMVRMALEYLYLK